MVVFLLLSMLAASNSGGVVVKPVANLYSAASADADMVSQAILGANVTLLEEKTGWARIRTADDYTGWVQPGDLRRLAAGEPPYASRGRVARVQSTFANLYREPSVTKHAPLLVAPFESRFEVIAEPAAEERRWLQVRLPDDRPAWVQRGDVTFDAKQLSIGETIVVAKRFLGLPYLWGGTSTFGYDCSGYTQMLYRHRGLEIPRDAGPQARWPGLAPVEKKDLKPGDLIYFGASLEKINHTGMYIGDGQFIHATTHRQPVIQISRLADEYWTRIYVTSRRLK